MINYEINRLVNFALQQGLLFVEDKIYAANLLLAALQLAEFTEEKVDETLETRNTMSKSLDGRATRQLNQRRTKR